MGWRYLLFILGALTLILWGLRFFVFHLFESPRFLIGKGKDTEAVTVIRKMAEFNSTTTSLSVEQLSLAGKASNEGRETRVLSKGSVYNVKHIKALFATKKMAFSTSLLMAIWGE